MKRSTGGLVRRAKTSAKEGSLFFLLCVQSSTCFSSIVGDASGVRGDEGDDEDRPRTVSGTERERTTAHFNVAVGKLRIPQPRLPRLPATTAR